MNETSSHSDPWQSGVAPQIKQDIEDTQGNIQQQAAIGNDNKQAQNASDEGEKLGASNLHDGAFSSMPAVGQQASSGYHNSQSQSTVVVNNILGKDFNIFDKDVPNLEKNHTLPDPTRPLPQKPRNLPEIKLDELSNYCQKLNEDSLIIVTSSDSSAAFSAAYSLTERLSVLSKRLFTGEWGTIKKLTTEPSIEIVLNSEIGKGEPILIIIDTYEIQSFLDSLVVQPSTAALIKQDLGDRQILCICLAESKTLRTTLERKQIKLSFPHWEIPFEQEAVTQKQQQDIRGQLVEPYEDGSTARSLYETVDTLKKTVLYVATFFQNLSIDDFERIVTLLLSDQTIPIIESEGRTGAPINSTGSTISVTIGDQIVTFNQSQKGQVDQEPVNLVSQPQTHQRRLLRDIWEEDPELILKSCDLELVPNEYGFRVIDFSTPHLRGELSDYFKNVKFIEYRNKFRKLVELNLLFDGSYQVARALRDLSVSMMLFQPGTEFWVNWLEQLTISNLACSANSKKTDFIYYCLSDLLRESLDYSQLEDFTGIFMERLISSKQHHVVLSLSKRLRFSPQFDGIRSS